MMYRLMIHHTMQPIHMIHSGFLGVNQKFIFDGAVNSSALIWYTSFHHVHIERLLQEWRVNSSKSGDDGIE